jgi:hypothetical protein
LKLDSGYKQDAAWIAEQEYEFAMNLIVHPARRFFCSPAFVAQIQISFILILALADA